MATKSFKWLALLCGVSIGAASLAHAQDSGPLIDTLVKKGVLTDQEGEDLRVELLKDFGTSSAGKLNLSSALTELKFYGDARVRYEYRTGESGNTPVASALAAGSTNNTQERNRFRYRLRFGFNGKFHDGWFFGTRLETGVGSRSTNSTAGAVTAANGVTSKDNNTLFVGQVYIGRTVEDFTFTAGRMPNPFVTTPMVWDDDINPEGLVEQWQHESGNVTWKANLGQLLYEGSGTTNPIGTGISRQNTFLWVAQAGAKVKFNNGSAVQVMPTYYGYSGSATSMTKLGTTAAGTNSGILRPTGLSIIDIPAEYSFKLGGLPAKVWVDYAYNMDAEDRAAAAGRPTFDGEDTAYQLGVGVGAAKVKGDWEAKLYYQSVDAFALDSNLVDSDLFDSRTNMEGFVTSFSYVLSNGVTAKFTYANAKRKEQNLASYGAGDIATPNLDNYQLFQADLNVKF
ncbi:MAG: putative porin [Opitutaceae bacterium]|jgi:hypothetical protein